MIKKPLIAILLVCFACSGTVYDRDIKTYRFEKPGQKISIGVLLFKDSRKETEIIDSAIAKKKSLNIFITQLAEEMLLRYGSFTSVKIITDLDLPAFNNPEEIEKFRKVYELDYIFSGEILEAKLVKKHKSTSIFYKIGIFLSKGFLPDSYEYIGNVKLKGKLIATENGKTIWDGLGKSAFKEKGYFRGENILIGATHNALGSLLSDMSSVFSLTIKEIN